MDNNALIMKTDTENAVRYPPRHLSTCYRNSRAGQYAVLIFLKNYCPKTLNIKLCKAAFKRVLCIVNFVLVCSQTDRFLVLSISSHFDSRQDRGVYNIRITLHDLYLYLDPRLESSEPKIIDLFCFYFTLIDELKRRFII